MTNTPAPSINEYVFVDCRFEIGIPEAGIHGGMGSCTTFDLETWKKMTPADLAQHFEKKHGLLSGTLELGRDFNIQHVSAFNKAANDRVLAAFKHCLRAIQSS